MFSDIQSHWTKASVLAAAGQNILKGYPDGTFRPDAPVTRAEFAVIIYTSLAFKQASSRPGVTFKDVPPNYWAAKAIDQAYQTNYLSGYSHSSFQPNQIISRVQALTALVSGLKYGVTIEPMNTLKKYYTDFKQIPNYAIGAIAAATEKGIVVNYPDIQLLRPNQSLTRGEIAAFICRIIEIPTVPFQYIPGRELFVISPQFDQADSFSQGLASVQKDRKWGYIDKTGSIVILAEFDDARSFDAGLAVVQVGNKWGYIDRTGQFIINPQFDEADIFSEELAAVKMGEKWGYINQYGDLIIPLTFDFAKPFSEGMALVNVGGELKPDQGQGKAFFVGGKWGYIRKP